MTNVSLILASLFTLYIALVLPLLGRRRYQKFRREAAINPALRSRYYLIILAASWLRLVAIGVILLFDSAPLSVLGLRAPDDWGSTFWLSVELLVLAPIMLVVLRYRIARTQRPDLASLLLKVKDLLPHTSYERWLWLLVSITAGICEEIVFRGFLLFYLSELQINFVIAIILSSILFGFAHIYQGWKAILGTGLIGLILAYLYVYTGSLILPIICHILIDARIVFLAPALLKLDRSAKV